MSGPSAIPHYYYYNKEKNLVSISQIYIKYFGVFVLQSTTNQPFQLRKTEKEICDSLASYSQYSWKSSFDPILEMRTQILLTPSSPPETAVSQKNSLLSQPTFCLLVHSHYTFLSCHGQTQHHKYDHELGTYHEKQPCWQIYLWFILQRYRILMLTGPGKGVP